MSTIKHLALVLALSSFAAACTSSDAAPAPQDPATTAKPAAAPSEAELHALCVEVMTRMRTCTDQYIPSLVDARARADKPAGIAAEVAKDRDAVIAIGRHDVVLGLERGDGPDRDGLLADVEVKEPADLSLRVRACGLLFKAADQEHLPIQIAEVIELPARTCEGRLLRYRLLGGRLAHGSMG